MDMNCVHSFLAAWGPWAVLAVGVGSIALTGLAFGMFLYSQLIGEQKADAHGHGGHGHDDHGHGAHH